MKKSVTSPRDGASCEVPASPASPLERGAETRLYTFDGQFAWSGVEPQAYKPPSEDWARVVRHVLIGARGEQTAFHVRYFEIAPGGYTSLEKHQHAHVIIGIRGVGRVVAGTECYELHFLDTLYIAPQTPHQLINESDEPFGFLCLVDAERDRPQPLDEEELERLKHHRRTRHVVRR